MERQFWQRIENAAEMGKKKSKLKKREKKNSDLTIKYEPMERRKRTEGEGEQKGNYLQMLA